MICVEDALKAVRKEAWDLFQIRRSRLLGDCESPAAGQARAAFQANTGFEVILEDVCADRPFPPFDRVLMDGIAVRLEDFDRGLLTCEAPGIGDHLFRVQAVQAAGTSGHELISWGWCIEVMTGACLPRRADTVIKYEDLERCQDGFRLRQSVLVELGQNIQWRGSECPQGQLLIPAGTALLAPHWAVLASVGLHRPLILPQPKIATIGTGDEVVPVESTPSDFQIRSSNPFALRAVLARAGFPVVSSHLVKDDPVALEDLLRTILAENEVCILTGAVSAGKFDFVPECLRKLGVVEVFHKVSQKPGKPMWFGRSAQGKLVFALPGNPVSALVNCSVYVIEALRILSGQIKETKPQYAKLKESIAFSHGESMTFFGPVAVEFGECGTMFAKPIQDVLSSSMAPLLASDGFVECKAGKVLFEKGECLPVRLW